MDQAEASGKTVDDALNKALAKLGASRDQVEFVVLDEGRKGGLFGRGAKEAVVRVERVAGTQPQPASGRQPDTRIPRGGQRGPRRDGGAPGAAPGADRPRSDRPDRGPRGTRPTSSSRPQSRTGFDSAIPKLTDADFLRKPSFEEGPEGAPPAGAPAAPGRERGGRGGRAPSEPRAPRADQPERPRGERPDRGERRHRDDEPNIDPDINAAEVDVAAQTVDDILRILDIPAELSIREPLTAGDGLGSVLAVIDIKGEDLGLLIGRRGETLLSLQYLVNLILAKRFPGRGGVTIDVEHYRHRREEQVISLARRMADRVRETGSPITLEPMTASERRLIHLLFAEDQELETNSVGEGDNRKVVISARP
jgi:spoIIIJ-associated protein